MAPKTASLTGVVNDAGIVRDDGLAVAIAVLCDCQRDPARTGIDIDDCALQLWRSLGGRVAS